MLEKFLISIGLKQPEYVEEVIPENTRTVRPSSENRFSNEDYTGDLKIHQPKDCLLYTSPSPRDQVVSRMPSSA